MVPRLFGQCRLKGRKMLSAAERIGLLAWLCIATSPAKAQITISTSSLPSAIQGQSYSRAQLAACCRFGAYEWKVSKGQLPPGIKLSERGVLEGSPCIDGKFDFEVQAAGKGPMLRQPWLPNFPALPAKKQLTIHVHSSPEAGFAAYGGDLGHAIAGKYYKKSIGAYGDYGHCTWNLVGGYVPPGLSLDSHGRLQGTPTSPGHYSFTVRGMDANDRNRPGVTRTLFLKVQSN